MTAIAWDLHDFILLLAILSCVLCVGCMLYVMVRQKHHYTTALRVLTIIGAVDLGAVWFCQLTGIVDLGAASQSFALPGAVLLIALHIARVIAEP